MRYQTATTLTPRQALDQAITGFGPGGVGLQSTSQADLGLGFQGVVAGTLPCPCSLT